jgi:hypothetical protein
MPEHGGGTCRCLPPAAPDSTQCRQLCSVRSGASCAPSLPLHLLDSFPPGVPDYGIGRLVNPRRIAKAAAAAAAAAGAAAGEGGGCGSGPAANGGAHSGSSAAAAAETAHYLLDGGWLPVGRN